MRTAMVYNFLIEANLIAGIAILLMIPVRKFFRKQLGSRVICFAWLLVAIRLLCPLALPNPLINEIITPYNEQPEVIRPIAAQFQIRLRDALEDASIANLENHIEREELTAREAMEKPDFQMLQNMSWSLTNGRGAKTVMLLYLLGAAGVAGWFAFANIRFRRALKKNTVAPLEGELLAYYQAQCEKYKVKPIPVFFADPLSSACLVGAVKPVIALPLAASVTQARQMLTHELCHYKAKDHIWTLLTLLCCLVHWFNPLVWAAAAMSRMDRELRCDENVTRDMDEEARKLYAGALIQSVTRRAIPGLPMLATGMSMTGRKLKTRVGGILRGGKRIKALEYAFAGLTSVLLVFAFATAAYGELPGLWDNEMDAGTRSYLVYEMQTREEALKSEKAIPTKEAALEIAKEILSGPAFQIDAEDPAISWTVEDSNGVRGLANYAVSGKYKDGGAIYVYMAVDGSGAWNVTNEADPYYMEEYPAVYEFEHSVGDVLSEEEQQRIKQYCLNLTETLEPGETEYFLEIHFNGYIQPDENTLYVQLEAPYNEDSGKTFVLQVKPEIRMIDYFSANG